MDKERIAYLVLRYLDNAATADELRELEAVLDEPKWDTTLKDAFGASYYQLPEDHTDELPGIAVKEKIFKYIVSQPQRKNIFRLWPGIAAAVIALLLVVSGTWIFLGDSLFTSQLSEVINGGDVAPGGNVATLTLAGGEMIGLEETQSGIKVGDKITYLDGTLVSSPKGSAKKQASATQESMASYEMQLTTPRGGTYQVTLSDGSEVWLNAGSKLTYPSKFAAEVRVVELSGEAYFNVVKDENRPFKIISNTQEIEVLGTEFNVSAYSDQSETRTTLVEGSVRVTLTGGSNTFSALLEPGQQSRVNGEAVRVQQVDIKEFTAWKDGLFYFKNTPFKEIMEQIALWYDVEIVYTNQIPNETFSGEIRRNSSLRTVLELLNTSAVHIHTHLKNRKLIVTNDMNSL